MLNNYGNCFSSIYSNVYPIFSSFFLEDDPRYDVVNDLQKTEREYCRLLRSILNTYGEPLRYLYIN